MNKKEYLPFHAKAIFSISEKIGKKLYANNFKSEITTAEYYKDHPISTEQQLLDLFNTQFKIDSTYLKDFIADYLKEILVNSNYEHACFFIKNHYTLLGEIYLGDLNPILSQINEKTILFLFEHSPQKMAIYQDQYLEQTISSIYTIKDIEKPLSIYLNKRDKFSIYHEDSNICVRDTIIKYFNKEQLDNFKLLPIIKKYLDMQNSNNLFDNSAQYTTFFISLNINDIQSKYPISGINNNLYILLLNKFVEKLKTKNNQFDISHIKFENDKNININIHIHCYQTTVLNLDLIKSFIEDYIIHAQQIHLMKNDDKTIYDKNYIENWISKKILNNQLNTNLEPSILLPKSIKNKI